MDIGLIHHFYIYICLVRRYRIQRGNQYHKTGIYLICVPRKFCYHLPFYWNTDIGMATHFHNHTYLESRFRLLSGILDSSFDTRFYHDCCNTLQAKNRWFWFGRKEMNLFLRSHKYIYLEHIYLYCRDGTNPYHNLVAKFLTTSLREVAGVQKLAVGVRSSIGQAVEEVWGHPLMPSPGDSSWCSRRTCSQCLWNPRCWGVRGCCVDDWPEH